jgi:hypothetical protein
MSGTPTFGRYAEIPVDQMPGQREGYRFLVDGPRGRAVSLTMNFYDVPAGSPGLAR